MQPTSVIPWSRYVALGDSLTEGVGDPVDGSLRGWANRLATSLEVLNPELSFWNLARRSLMTSQVYETQVERALELEPDLVSVVVGMNDLLSRNFDVDAYGRDLDAIVSATAETKATILMGTFPKQLPLLRLLPPRVARATRRRLQEASDVVLDLAADHGALCIDAPVGWRYKMAECSIDGCHPNARGHAHIAQLGLEVLCERAGIPLPGIDGGGYWLPGSARHLRWLVSQGYVRSAPGLLLSKMRGQ